MSPYYKATRPDGTDFRTGKIDYGRMLGTSVGIKHPNPGTLNSSEAGGYFSVSTVPTDCTSFQWPALLFEVEIVGESWKPDSSKLPNKRAGHELLVIAKLPAWQLFGPRGESIVAIIDARARLTTKQVNRLIAARDDKFWTAWDELWSVASGGRAGRAGLRAARDALCGRLYDWSGDDAAYGAALAVLFQDIITPQVYRDITAPWREVVGPVQPSDALPARAVRA
jgi:hypothetical protein